MPALSKKEKLSEIAKCSKDPVYFLTKYGRVRDPIKGIVPFNLYDYQEGCIQSFKEKRFNIWLKTRQTGASTIAAGYISWLICFKSAKEIVVVANKKKNAQGFIRKVKLIIKACPKWLIPEIDNDNMGSIVLKNGSRVEAEATTSDSARSESLSLLVIDEAAAIETNKVNDLWAAAYPTLSLGGSGIIISTPKGVGNFYHKQWIAAENGENDFNKIKVHWTMHPVYSKGTVWTCQECNFKQDQSDFNHPVCDACGKSSLKPSSPWYVDQCRQLGDPRKIAQELDMDFLGSGDNVIQNEYIKQAETNVIPPKTISGFDNNLWIWEEPKEKSEYLISADVSRGDGSDYSACHVLKLDKLTTEQVAEYKGKLPPDIYAKLLVELGRKYNNALLAVEANSIGYATCLKIVELEYPNIFYSMRGQFTNRDKRKLEKSMLNSDGMVPGFQTTTATRPLVVTQLEEKVRTETVIIRSTRTVTEFRTLIWKPNGKAEALDGYNDDLSMALGIGLLIIDTTLNDLISTKESIIASLTNYSRTSSTIGDLDGFVSNISSRQNNPWVMTVGDREEDLTWLLGKKRRAK